MYVICKKIVMIITIIFYPFNTKSMKIFKWKYTQYSQFNETDTLLLVSGVHFGTTHSPSGEIAVFNLGKLMYQSKPFVV